MDVNQVIALQDRIDALAASIGPKAEVFMHLGVTRSYYDKDKGPIYWNVKPYGYQNNGEWSISGHAFTFDEALMEMEAEYNAQKDARDVATVEKIALAIIRITNDIGECTDVALRTDTGLNLDKATIARLGEQAVVVAYKMASRGPFRIINTDLNDNGAPADGEDIPY